MKIYQWPLEFQIHVSRIGPSESLREKDLELDRLILISRSDIHIYPQFSSVSQFSRFPRPLYS